jgi:hypothetical protein
MGSKGVPSLFSGELILLTENTRSTFSETSRLEVPKKLIYVEKYATTVHLCKNMHLRRYMHKYAKSK